MVGYAIINMQAHRIAGLLAKLHLCFRELEFYMVDLDFIWGVFNYCQRICVVRFFAGVGKLLHVGSCPLRGSGGMKILVPSSLVHIGYAFRIHDHLHPLTPSPLTSSPPHPSPPHPHPLTSSPPHPLTSSPPYPLTSSPPHLFTPSPPHPLTSPLTPSPPHLLTPSPLTSSPPPPHLLTPSPPHLLTSLPPHLFTPSSPHPLTPSPLTPSPPHPLTPSPPHPGTVTDLHWLSSFLFAVVYTPQAPANSAPSFVFLSVPVSDCFNHT